MYMVSIKYSIITNIIKNIDVFHECKTKYQFIFIFNITFNNKNKSFS